MNFRYKNRGYRINIQKMDNRLFMGLVVLAVMTFAIVSWLSLAVIVAVMG